MKTIGIIAEYNPFHSGHAWQLAEAKKRTGADFALVVMSGDFVQRGEPAMTDKHTRTEMALLGGADLVAELPVQYACGSAEYFARGACALLDRLGVVDTLCFGCENELPDAFSTLADLLADEPAAFSRSMKKYLTDGNTFPKARLLALEDYLKNNLKTEGHTAADAARVLLSAPNNTLGLEYLIAGRRQGCSFDFLPIKRQGAGYHCDTPSGNFASATALRQDQRLADRYIPAESLAVLQNALRQEGMRRCSDFSAMLHYALLTCEDYTAFLDISSDLADRIRSLLPRFVSFDQFVSLLKTKQMTETRIRRCLLHILLGIRKEPIKKDRFTGLSYARVLGFRRSALPLLGEIKKRGRIPLITRAADGKKRLSGTELAQFELNLRASSIYHAASPLTVPYNEYKKQIILV